MSPSEVPVVVTVSVPHANVDQLKDRLSGVLEHMSEEWPAICGGPMPTSNRGYALLFDNNTPVGVYGRFQQIADELGGVVTYSSRMPLHLGTLHPDTPEYHDFELIELPNGEQCRFEPYDGPTTGGNV